MKGRMNEQLYFTAQETELIKRFMQITEGYPPWDLFLLALAGLQHAPNKEEAILFTSIVAKLKATGHTLPTKTQT